MARTKSDGENKNSDKVVARPPRAKTTSQKIEELKLGKFAEHKPMRLPEKETDRSQQLIGAAALMLMALAGVSFILKTEPLVFLFQGNDPMSFGAQMANVPWYWMLAEVMALVATICCIVAGAILLAKRRVPVMLWYILVIVMTVGLLCVSFHSFKWFEELNCAKRVRADGSSGGTCGGVEDKLIVLTLRNLMLYTAGLVAFFGVWKFARHKSGRKTRR